MSDAKKLGYDDTPIIPGTSWHVHDGNRPQPRVVTPGTFSTQETPGRPPSDATVLFDGAGLDGWRDKDGNPVKWKVENGYMEVVPHTGDIFSKTEFGDCQLHVEWAAPAETGHPVVQWLPSRRSFCSRAQLAMDRRV